VMDSTFYFVSTFLFGFGEKVKALWLSWPVRM